MGKKTKIWFSKEHTGRSSGRKERDTYRRTSDSSKTEKVGHNPVSRGHGKDPVDVPIKKK